MNWTPIEPSGTVEGFCLIKTVDIKTSSKGDTYLDLTLSDAAGEINAKIWSYSPERFGRYEVGQLIKVRGTVSTYKDTAQLRIAQIRPASPSDNVRAEDFVPSAAYDTAEMYSEILRLADTFQNKDLTNLVKTLYEQRKDSLLYWPAAFKLHHAIRGGLLLHTLSIVRLCESVCAIYPYVNRDLLLTGAMLHDIGKTEEFDVPATGIATGYTSKGNLIGHLAEGAILVRQTAKELNIDESLSNLVEHMILSHHGEPEFGAAVRPAFTEAELLSELDMLDARMYEMKETTDGLKAGEFSARLWSMDNRKLYQHGLSDKEESVKLF